MDVNQSFPYLCIIRGTMNAEERLEYDQYMFDYLVVLTVAMELTYGLIELGSSNVPEVLLLIVGDIIEAFPDLYEAFENTITQNMLTSILSIIATESFALFVTKNSFLGKTLVRFIFIVLPMIQYLFRNFFFSGIKGGL